MTRHKLNVYLDASVEGKRVGIGIVMYFDDWECFRQSTLSKLKTSHVEVAEFIALHRSLQRLVGGITQEFYNTDILLLTDSSILADYINHDIIPRSFPDDLMSSCDKLIYKLRNPIYNNKVKLKWISRNKNKAHRYAYEANIYNNKTEQNKLYKARELSTDL